MGLFSNSADFTKRAAAKTAKTGGKFIWWGTKKAARGTVWVVKKAAVDVPARKISNWGLVKNASAVREAVKRGECANCGKKFNNKNGKLEFCKIDCSLAAFESWSDVEGKKVNIHARKINENSLYYNCGEHNKNGYTDWQHDQICDKG